jgi:tetratricopeptide (TPR) repeat protein
VAHNLDAQGKYAAAQPLHEKALEIRRGLLGNDHPDTALSYNNLAGNLDRQGKYGAAQPLLEKALEILRRLLGDDHPDTAVGYNNLALNLMSQGKYAQAQPLFEKAHASALVRALLPVSSALLLSILFSRRAARLLECLGGRRRSVPVSRRRAGKRVWRLLWRTIRVKPLT